MLLETPKQFRAVDVHIVEPGDDGGAPSGPEGPAQRDDRLSAMGDDSGGVSS